MFTAIKRFFKGILWKPSYITIYNHGTPALSTSQRTMYKLSSMDLCLQKQHWLSLPILCLLNWPLTWFHLVNGLDLGQLDGCYPTLSFCLWWAFEVICLRASIGNDEAAGVLCVDERVEDADGTTRCTACHICLTPVIHTQKSQQLV